MIQTNTKEVVLVGFSGGGTIAMLIAAQRKDVVGIVTLAGLFDHVKWSRYHDISELKESMNPANIYQDIKDIPQYHLLAADDDRVPVILSKKEIAKLRALGGTFIKEKTISDIDHTCCWDTIWPTVLQDVHQHILQQ